MNKIDYIKEDYKIGDYIRISCSLGTKEGCILAFYEDRIKLMPLGDSKKPIVISNDTIGDWEEAHLTKEINPNENGAEKTASVNDSFRGGQAKHEIEAPIKKENINNTIEKKENKATQYDVGDVIPLKELKRIDPTLETKQRISSKKEVQQGIITETEINKLMQQDSFEEVIRQINIGLNSRQCDLVRRSKLLIHLAQAYSAIKDLGKAQNAYKDLIDLNITLQKENKGNTQGVPVQYGSRISQYYIELARLQSQSGNNKGALLSVRKAREYNSNNPFVNNLLTQLSTGDKEMVEDVSEMLSADIEQYEFSDERILENNGIPTPLIAETLYEEACSSKKKNIDQSGKYALYREAAKAFKMLNPGSYSFEHYSQALSYYSKLKGDTIFYKYRNAFTNNGANNKEELVRLTDSACSYYMESLVNIPELAESFLYGIMVKYMVMNMNTIKAGVVNINSTWGEFEQVLNLCLEQYDVEMHKIPALLIVQLRMINRAWNKLTDNNKFYHLLSNENSRRRLYVAINKILQLDIPLTKDPKDFFSDVERNQRFRLEKINEHKSIILKQDMDMSFIDSIQETWQKTKDVISGLLLSTDKETSIVIETVLANLKPYNARKDIEKYSLLIKQRELLEKQIDFIGANTTYYGRTFFFRLLTKWRNELGGMLDEKIANQFQPKIEVIPDPPYLLNSESCDKSNRSVNIIAKNIGEATADGFELTVNVKSLSNDIIDTIYAKYENKELPISATEIVSIRIPSSFNNLNVIEITIDACCFYQNRTIKCKPRCYTLELEPKSVLQIEDIKWNYSSKVEGLFFKGRHELIEKLKKHYLSTDRDKSYILYGLTRYGKSSILLKLKDELKDEKININGQRYNLATFSWDLTGLPDGNAADMWQQLVYLDIYEKLPAQVKNGLSMSENPRFKDFKRVIEHLHSQKIYPIIFIDEFSFIRQCIDKKIVTSSFLHSLRQMALDGLASFVFAGTYDIKELLKNKEYGITGQLVNTIEKQIDKIDKLSAKELMEIQKPNLQFTDEAIETIHYSSGDVPYFIQIICWFCATYAIENKRTVLGNPEVLTVISALCGEIISPLISRLPEGNFGNNMVTPTDPEEVNALISSIAELNKDCADRQSGVSISDLEKLWDTHGVLNRPKLADAISLLLDKKILKPSDDDETKYVLSVDLFRRWWRVGHRDIKLELAKIKD